MITGSQWERVLACEAAGVLPQVEHRDDVHAERGKAIHQYLATAGALGPAAALEQVPPMWREACAALDLGEIPQIDPAHYAHEIALAFDFDTGFARELHRGGGRDYSMVRPAEVPITLDVVGITGDGGGVVIDWKTGWLPVARASTNPQLLYGAFVLSRAHRLTYARIAIGYVRDESARFDYAELDALDISGAEAMFREAWEINVRAREEYVEHQRARCTTGDHCRRCPSFAYCPAQTALVQAFGADAGMVERETKRMLLSPETARLAVRKLAAAKQAIGRIEAALKAHAADNGGIDMGDGTTWGPVVTTREELDGATVRAVLLEVAFERATSMEAPARAEFAREVAEGAVTLATTKRAIGEAATALARASGGKAAPIEREILERVRAREGGVARKVRTEFDFVPRPSA